MRRPDRGSATVYVVAAIGAVAALLLGALTLVSASRASSQARTAADLGALAGAQALVAATSEHPCSVAAQVAQLNSAQVRRCEISGEEVELVVAVAPSWPGLGDAQARSRAGPARDRG
ncbi:Rv3654c family TadE-like protein [Demetria terragena]|uniref:Rv3654c family TadE-like protein n=1 Tax=Demetria terragena TaxID=63959 RepID=UPI00036F0B3B|nr:Rv3654c family TadE-like protein [Demetria terragena]